MDSREFGIQFDIEETNWWFVARRRLVRRFAEQVRAELGRPLRILDVACATAMSFRFLADLGTIRGLDISNETIHFAKQRGIDRIVRGDAQKMPFRDGSFDLVLALDAFEHFPDDVGSMGEVRRVLAAGGTLICTVPAYMSLWSPHDDAFHHLRRYTRGELGSKIRGQSLDVKRLSYYSMFLTPPLWVFRKLRKLTARGKPASSDFTIPLPGIVEGSLAGLMKLEAFMLRFVDLPVGASLICVSRKN
jgi:SAM-dependent methyltransferase